MSLVRAQQGEPKKKTIRTGWSFSLLLVSLCSKEFAGFASRNRRRTAAEGKLIGGCCADAVESQQGEPKKRPSEPDGLFLCFSYRCARKSLPVSHRAAGAIFHRVRQHTISHAASPYISLFPADFPADLTKTLPKIYICLAGSKKSNLLFLPQSLLFTADTLY